MNPLLAFIEGMFSPTHVLLLLAIGILLFGKRLPEVGRSLGKGIVEFKKGLKGLEDEVVDNTTSPSSRPAEPMIEQPRPPQRVTATAPKFEDTTGGTAPPPQA